MTSSDKTTLKVGNVLNDKCVILAFIGKGGMGEVYRAHQSNLNRDVAIKVVAWEWLASLNDGDEEAETLVQRFRREVQTMAQIRHPNILQVFDHDLIKIEKEDQQTSIEYITMEYIPGGSLRDTMSEYGFYPDEDGIKNWVSRYFLPVLSGVAALHDNGIVHRDLKPENILMDRDIPKIADFGLARSSGIKPLTQSVDVRGSLHYMSPEHFSDFKRADQRADVYSLGKILFEAVDGKIKAVTTPFRSTKLAKAESPFFSELDRIIQQATAENREERTESIQAFHEQLERIISDVESTKQTVQSPRQDSISLFSKLKWFWLGLLVAVLSIVAVTAWHFMGEPDLFPAKGGGTSMPSKHQPLPKTGLGKGLETIDTDNEAFQAEHLGRQQLIFGGAFKSPGNSAGDNAQETKVDDFFMDEFFISNQQFVDFLNHNLSRITIENGVVQGEGVNWFLLGEVRTGYEPIVFRNNEFHIGDPAYASSPVLRATGFGASAFASFFGRRLPTESEMLYAMIKGLGAGKATADQRASDPERRQATDRVIPSPEMPPDIITKDNLKVPDYQLSAASFAPNLLGIRGLNHEIGEWVHRDQIHLSENTQKPNRFAVIGGVEGTPDNNAYLPAIVERFPWEGCEDTGFRTAKSASSDYRGKSTEAK